MLAGMPKEKKHVLGLGKPSEYFNLTQVIMFFKYFYFLFLFFYENYHSDSLQKVWPKYFWITFIIERKRRNETELVQSIHRLNVANDRI